MVEKNMKFTKNKPKEPGFYWIKDPRGTGRIEIVEVYPMYDELQIGFLGEDCTLRPKRKDPTKRVSQTLYELKVSENAFRLRQEILENDICILWEDKIEEPKED
jgi:hypothetical protein